LLEERIDRSVEDAFISMNTNPLKCIILCIDIINQVFKRFRVMFLRCKRITKPLEKYAKEIINSFLAADELKLILKQRDLHGATCCGIWLSTTSTASLDAKVMDRILQDYWNSNVDVTGRFFDSSTPFKIFKLSNFAYSKDQEAAHRFYLPRTNDLTRPHLLQFEVWKRSMSVRYMLELAIFISVALFFQFEITAFNQNLHLMNKYREATKLHEELDPYTF